MSKTRLIRELTDYLRKNKKLFLLPLLVLLGIAGIVALLSQAQALAPFIYALF